MTITYNPAARFDVKVRDIEFRRTPSRALLARIYQPQGPGPFPTVLDLHGGAWNDKDRLANVPVDDGLAASGILVVAIDLRLAGEAPYPASVQDANYGIRWLKSKAAEWHGDASALGVFGSSSGGHVAQLCAMRPRDPRYNAHPLPEAPGIDATIAYLMTRAPISDPYARFQQAEKRQRTEMIRKSRTYFQPWESIFEANPQQMLERGEVVAMPPMLLMQGELDENVLPSLQEKFAATYRAAGGEIQLEIFKACDHNWVEAPGPRTDDAIEMAKAFIARQLGVLRLAA